MQALTFGFILLGGFLLLVAVANGSRRYARDYYHPYRQRHYPMLPSYYEQERLHPEDLNYYERRESWNRLVATTVFMLVLIFAVIALSTYHS